MSGTAFLPVTIVQVWGPASQEMLIIVQMFVFLFLLPLAIVLLVLYLAYRRYATGTDHAERIEELERDMKALEREVGELRQERRIAPGEPDDELE